MADEFDDLTRRIVIADEDDDGYAPDMHAARVVVAYLYATYQDDEADDLEAYFGREEGWGRPQADSAQPESHADADVPDSLTWGRALLDFIRSLPPVQAAFVGAMEVSPSWWSAAETMPIGKIANMLEMAEEGLLDREERPDWQWFPRNPPSWEVFLRGAPAFTPFPPRRQP